MLMKPLAIDLFCGLGGWTDGLLAEGYEVIGYDIETHAYGDMRYPAQLVLQDVLTLHGAQFKDVTLIVASPPCQEYSYMAMPWKLAKAKAAAIRADTTGESLERLNRLFRACFRIQKEASMAASRHVPMVVENVRGAQPWVGRARWNFGSFYLWGDVPALMPQTLKARKFNPARIEHIKNNGGSWFNIANNTTSGHRKNPVHALASIEQTGIKAPGMNWSDQTKRGQDFTRLAGHHALKNAGHLNQRDGHTHTPHLTNPEEHVADGRKHHGDWFRDPACPSRQGGQLKPPARISKQPPAEGRKGAGAGAGAEWFDQNTSSLPSNSPRRKMASAMIAKIPLTLSRHIAAVYRP